MWVRSLGREDPLEEGMAAHSIFKPRETMDRGAWQATVHWPQRAGLTEVSEHWQKQRAQPEPLLCGGNGGPS